MSGSDRKVFRESAKAAMLSDPYFAEFTEVSAWSQSLDAETCPLFAVATPQEVQLRDSQEVVKCTLSLVVVIKILGAETIEDGLDDAVDAASAAICAAIRSRHIFCELNTVSLKVDGSGQRRVGSVDLNFSITYWVDDPATS